MRSINRLDAAIRAFLQTDDGRMGRTKEQLDQLHRLSHQGAARRGLVEVKEE